MYLNKTFLCKCERLWCDGKQNVLVTLNEKNFIIYPPNPPNKENRNETLTLGSRYSFSVLEDSGWNFRHAYYHEMNRRTLLKVRLINVSIHPFQCSTLANCFSVWSGFVILTLTYCYKLTCTQSFEINHHKTDICRVNSTHHIKHYISRHTALSSSSQWTASPRSSVWRTPSSTWAMAWRCWASPRCSASLSSCTS